jgi:N-acetylmuramoyl-L-alanine amidase
VLFGYYWFLLRNKVFHGYNRFYLLAIVGLSILLPLCRINVFAEKHVTQTSVIKMLQVVTDGDEYMDEVIIGGSQQSNFSIINFLPFMYALVSVVLLALFLQMLLTIYNLLRKHTHTRIEDIHFINTEAAKGTPFSFFKCIFWNNQISLHSPEGNRIFKHELAHIQERHSWDKIFINLMLIVFWCNPIFWLIRKELSMIHEFIADKRAVEDGDTAAFAAMILSTTYPQHNITIANNFFYSPIKRRLMMLTKNNNPRVNYISRLLVLPLLVVVFAAFTIKAKVQNDFTNFSTDKPITVVIDAGHGGTDPGAININGVSEKDMALTLAKKVKELNKNPNLNLILSREIDVFNNIVEKAEFANLQKANLFVSIHLSGSPKAKYNKETGLEIYISRDSFTNSIESKSFGYTMLDAFKNNYQLPVKEKLVQRKQGIWVLQEVNAPSVLIEAGFITTDKDLAYLQSEKGQEAFATNVLNGINNYVTSKKASSTNNKDKENLLSFIESSKITDNNYEKVNASENLNTFKTSLVKNEVLNNTSSNTIAKPNNFNSNLEEQKVNNQLVHKNQMNMQLSNTKDLNYLIANDTPKNRVLFTKVENEAEFIGGKDAWIKYLQKNLNASIPVSENWKPGKYVVLVKFIVEKDGSLTEVTTENYKKSKTAAACISLLKNSPKWKPAIQNGNIVASYKIQPITFIVEDEGVETKQQSNSILNLGDIKGGKLKLEILKNATEITAYQNLKIVSCNVYFGGAGFVKVIVGSLSGNGLVPLKELIEKCMAGTNIVFTNIKVKTKDGIRTLDEVAFALY